MTHQGWVSAEPNIRVVTGGFAFKLVRCIAHHPVAWMVQVYNKTTPSDMIGFGKAAA